LVVSSDPSSRVWTARGIVDDGAVLYVNGQEVHRFNMRTNALSHTSLAASAVGDPVLSLPVNIPANRWVVGTNQIAVQVHQNAGVTNGGLRVTASTGMRAAWDGRDGDYGSASSTASVPQNGALAASGTVAFASSNPARAGRVNDRHYGAGGAWFSIDGDAAPHLILQFPGSLSVSNVAWSRDNGDFSEPDCGGTCPDACFGNYTLQYTLAASPSMITATGNNPSTSWVSIATVAYSSLQPGFTPHLRHRFTFQRTNGEPILATGFRLRVPAGSAVDELEINTPTRASDDATFGLEVSSAPILPPAPSVRFNEVSEGGNAGFWIELINTGSEPMDLAGLSIVRTGNPEGRVQLPSQMLGQSAKRVLTHTDLGFTAQVNQKLFLYGNAGLSLLDSVQVQSRLRGRSPDGTGRWETPSMATPGEPNLFSLQKDVVINEIMHRAPSIDAQPGVISNHVVVPITAPWKFHDQDVDLGAMWREVSFDDSSWKTGSGVFHRSAIEIPGPAGQELLPGASTYYFRKRFIAPTLSSNASVTFRWAVDDGAVMYLNGRELLRANLPRGEVAYSTEALTLVGDVRWSQPIVIPADQLLPGDNLLSVEVHQKGAPTNYSGITLVGGGLQLVQEGPAGEAAPDNLARESGATPLVIDSLEGFPIHAAVGLTDGVYGNANSWIGNSGSPAYAGVKLAGLRWVSGIAFGRDNTGTFTDRTLGLYTLQYTELENPGRSTPVTGNPATGWTTLGTLNYRSGGSGLFANASRRHRYTFDPVRATAVRLLVPGAGIGSGTCIDELEINPPDTGADVLFASELSLRTELVPPIPFSESAEEWIELFNRGVSGMDLTGWQLDGAVGFTFPTGTLLPPGGFLVVAADAPALKQTWPEVAPRILGNYSGRLSSGERIVLRDVSGNLADETRVFAGEWDRGGGSSLELMDPHSDNSVRDLWMSSDETRRSDWHRISYRMVAAQRYGSSFWNEFRIGMLDAGECLIDDVSVVSDPDTARREWIQNGGFDPRPGGIGWRLLGNHDRSQVIPDPADPSNPVLKISATGPARTSHNHIETSVIGNSRWVDGREYEVSFRARWLAGSPQLHTSAYFQRLARVTILPMPTRHGTPGSPNSRFTTNAGPALTLLSHSPLVPRTSEPVVVSVRATDPQGVRSMMLSYRVNPAISFTNVPMTRSEDGLWRGMIPGFASGRVIQFFAQAEDEWGSSSMAPAGGPESRALYQVADNQSSRVPAHEFRVIQLDLDRDALLRSTNLLSQQRRGGTMVYRRSEVFYDVGIRLHGSAAGRARDGDDYISYDVEFRDDNLFRGTVQHVGIDRSGRTPVPRQQDEIYVLHMFHSAGLPCHRTDLCYFIAPRTIHTGPAILQLGAYDGQMIGEQFGRTGSVFNMDLTYEPSTTVDGRHESLKLPVPLQGHIGTDLADLGDDKEQYRSPFNIRLGERADDFTGIMRLGKTMGSPQTQFNEEIGAALDLNQAARHTALTILCGIGDSYFSSTPSLPHNARIFTPHDGGPAYFLPWDMDFVFLQASEASIFPTDTVNLSKLIKHPLGRRLYLWHIYDLCQQVFHSGPMTPWLRNYGTVVGQSYLGQTSYLQSRRSAALLQLPPGVSFAITNQGGMDFETNVSKVVISGTAWLDIREIRRVGDPKPLAVEWTDATRWRAEVDLQRGPNLISLVAVGNGIQPIAEDRIVITRVDGPGLDSDSDGLPDEWERKFGTDPSVFDSEQDLDEDGMKNLGEYLSGTHPRDPASVLRLSARIVQEGVGLTFESVAGRSYTLWYRADAYGGEWIPWMDFGAAPAGRQESVVAPFDQHQRFYRITTPSEAR
ncbi:MAG: hypothetical protein FJ405_03890, partial [Verrucomicrobia bacterium]|nr:hypothetical protein [Verrucomicrobiota bacterium]